MIDISQAAIGYTIATGRLYCGMPELQRAADELMGHGTMTHEYGDETFWAELRERFEAEATAAYNAGALVGEG